MTHYSVNVELNCIFIRGLMRMCWGMNLFAISLHNDEHIFRGLPMGMGRVNDFFFFS